MSEFIIPGKGFLLGGDYNPDQWKRYPQILEEDIRLMKISGCNTMTVGIFSWSEIEPQEGVYNFEFMDSVIERLEKNGINVIMATPSGARPAWLSEKYPEVLRTTERFEKRHHGERHNHCYNSKIYKEKTANINRVIAKRYKDKKNIIMWHISNEYNGMCFCKNCAAEFRLWLKQKYKNNIDELNHAWWNAFWSHNYSNFDQIEPPSPIGECSIHALNLEWKRFVTDRTIEFYLNEINAVKSVIPDAKVTTNWYWVQEELNLKKFSKYVDAVAWDDYPEWHSPMGDFNVANETAFKYNCVRGFKNGQPFILMESTPSNVSYREANTLKRPEMTLSAALQAIGHGSDSVMFFQWRKSRGSFEKFHGAVVDHEGSENTRTFKEVCELSGILKSIADIKNLRVKSEAAIIYDRENYWALNECLGFKTKNYKYDETCYAHHKCLYKRSINVDVISPEDDYSHYKLLIIPMLYMMSEETGRKIKAYIENGGTAVMTYMSAYTNEIDLCYLKGFPGSGLREVFGIWNEEIDSLFDGVTKKVADESGKTYNALDYCELLHSEGSEVLARYDEDFYSGMAAATVNRYGRGKAYYIGFRDDGAFLDEFYGKIADELELKSHFKTPLPKETVAVSRRDDDNEYIFVQNFSENEVIFNKEYGDVMLSRTRAEGGKIVLSPYETTILKRRLK